EKIEIGKRFLGPKAIEGAGLTDKNLTFKDEAFQTIIQRYTREAGVRNLEREIASICRKVARKVVVQGASFSEEITSEKVTEYLGVPRFRPSVAEEKNEVGIATGLAWTEVGGEILETEVGLMRGTGKLILTGKLGEVMQESARAALSYLRSRADLLGIDPEFTEKHDLHIHVPEGAIPKDGPSAGITMATALVSAVTRRPVRRDLAMTGEITLRGKVLPVGGIKDKALAAFRAGIHQVILPRENEKDLEDIPVEVREILTVHFVESMDEVLHLALEGELASPPPGGGELQSASSEPPMGSGSLAH
ncbi:MAG TPA: S16 family serine protease, partial [Thermoanaerobaculia bacterium]|nr:S16 family serine protease [Thermoanaerobaculia bacterium]